MQSGLTCNHKQGMRNSALAPDFLKAVSSDNRRAVAIERPRQLPAKPDAALLQIHFVRHIPHHRLPVRVKNEVTRIAEQLDAIAARLEAVEEVGLRRAVLGGASLDANV